MAQKWADWMWLFKRTTYLKTLSDAFGGPKQGRVAVRHKHDTSDEEEEEEEEEEGGGGHDKGGSGSRGSGSKGNGSDDDDSSDVDEQLCIDEPPEVHAKLNSLQRRLWRSEWQAACELAHQEGSTKMEIIGSLLQSKVCSHKPANPATRYPATPLSRYHPATTPLPPRYHPATTPLPTQADGLERILKDARDMGKVAADDVQGLEAAEIAAKDAYLLAQKNVKSAKEAKKRSEKLLASKEVAFDNISKVLSVHLQCWNVQAARKQRAEQAQRLAEQEQAENAAAAAAAAAAAPAAAAPAAPAPPPLLVENEVVEAAGTSYNSDQDLAEIPVLVKRPRTEIQSSEFSKGGMYELKVTFATRYPLPATRYPLPLIVIYHLWQIELNAREHDRAPDDVRRELASKGFLSLQDITTVDEGILELLRPGKTKMKFPFEFTKIFNETFKGYGGSGPGRRQGKIPKEWSQKMRSIYTTLFVELFKVEPKEVEVGDTKLLERRAGQGKGLMSQARHCDRHPGACRLRPCCNALTNTIHSFPLRPRYLYTRYQPARYSFRLQVVH